MKGFVYFAPAGGCTLLMSKTRLFLELHRPNPGVDDTDNIRTLRERLLLNLKISGEWL
jgi:hypothetical protein